jgi:uncharacterized glyoxalase superfamily protein PhnB
MRDMNEPREAGDRAATHVWPTMKYDDAPAAIRFLVDVLGFEERLVVPGTTTDVIAHAELAWPAGGGVMLGSKGGGAPELEREQSGVASVYVVCDEPDAIFERATQAGATVVLPIRDEDYGSREFTVKDPGGNLWTFGTYGGA